MRSDAHGGHGSLSGDLLYSLTNFLEIVTLVLVALKAVRILSLPWVAVAAPLGVACVLILFLFTRMFLWGRA